jgi:hypothetical protein
MPQKEKDNKILQSIRGKQVAWMSKKLSFVAKNLVANQVIPVSIWYVVSCVNLSLFAMKKVKSLIRNYVWLNQVDGKARAKVAWGNTTCINGGIKILDLETQTIALFTKMLIRGLTPRVELWKVFLCHWVVNLRQSYRGC